MVGKSFRSLTLAGVITVVALGGSGGANAMSSAAVAAAADLGGTGAITQVQSRRSIALSRFAAIRAAVAPGGRNARERVAIDNGRRFSTVAATLRCRRNPAALGCGLVSPSRR